ncbi:MAG: dienelactone hydrolase family protein [Bacteroidota bacterium]
MKRIMPILLLGVSFFLSANRPAEKTSEIPLCHGISNFNEVANSPEFIAAHPYAVNRNPNFNPLGDMIKIKTGGAEANAYLVKAKKKTNKYLFIVHEWWGLNDNIKREAEEWAEKLGVNALAIDMYDGKVATTPEKAGQYMRGLDENRAKEILAGAQTYMGSTAQIATIGWCFGGGWSLKSTLEFGAQAIGCVMYYGMPVKDVDVLKTLNTDVLGLFAGKERWISPKVVAEFEANMKAAGKKLDAHSFDADHAFANPSSARYDKEAATKANALAYAYLKGKFK